MSGLLKPKKYDWKDSNLALFGSDTEKQVKKESAESEPAWQGAGAEPGLKCWRIVNFQVEDWPQESYGEFFSGDSYIILNTYKEEDSDALLYDAHFWIGKHSTQDEYGTAAYKTVELDTFLDDKAVQHREVDGHESELFKGYFPSIQRMNGGAESGFRHVEPEQYEPRLIRFSGSGRVIETSEVGLSASSLKSGDVFIVDMGQKLFQWNGSESQGSERFKAAQYLSELASSRGGADTEVVEEADVDDSHEMFSVLTGDPDDDDEEDEVDADIRSLKRLSNVDGEINIDDVKDDDLSMDDLDSNDVYLIDGGSEVFVWVGSGADPVEKKNSLPYAQQYLKYMAGKMSCRPVTVVNEGRHCPQLVALFA